MFLESYICLQHAAKRRVRLASDSTLTSEEWKAEQQLWEDATRPTQFLSMRFGCLGQVRSAAERTSANSQVQQQTWPGSRSHRRWAWPAALREQVLRNIENTDGEFDPGSG